MKLKLEIQVLSPLTKEQLIALRDELRTIEGLEAFDLKLPPAPPKAGTMMGGAELTALIVHGLLAGMVHFGGEKATEFLHHKIKSVLKKFSAAAPDGTELSPEAMGGKVIEAVISEHNGDIRTTTYINGDGDETVLSNRDYSINPELTHAILIGVSEYEDSENFSPIPPVSGNLDGMYHVLNDKRLMGLPLDNIHRLYNETSVNIIKKLNQVSRIPGIETLLVYYTGHGQNTGSGRLSLIARDTHNIDERLHSAISYEEVERVLKTSPASQKIVILDACHSGLAAQGSNANVYDFEPVYGTYTLASTSADEASYFKRDSPNTYFTGYILKLFSEGISNINTMLSLNDLYTYTSEQLQKNSFPSPVRKFDIRNVDESKFFISTNPAFDLKALQRKPVDLLMQGMTEEAEIEFYRLLREYPNDTAWLKEYEEVKKDVLFNKLVFEGDRLFMQGKFKDAKHEYIQAKNLNNTSYINLKIADCNKKLAALTDATPAVGSGSVTTKPVPPIKKVIPPPVENKKQEEKAMSSTYVETKAPVRNNKKYLIGILLTVVLITAVWLIWKMSNQDKNQDTVIIPENEKKTDSVALLPPITLEQAQSLVDRMPEKLKSAEGLPDDDQATFDSLVLIINTYPEKYKDLLVNLYKEKAKKLLGNNLERESHLYSNAAAKLTNDTLPFRIDTLK